MLQIKELKSKLKEDCTEPNVSVKEEQIPSDSDNRVTAEQSPTPPTLSASDHLNGLKDGSSDSDSSAILNDENNNSSSPTAGSISSATNGGGPLFPAMIKFGCGSGGGGGSSSMNCYQVGYQPQFVKIEEHNFFSGEEACNFFSDEQAPTLQWYCPDQWT